MEQIIQILMLFLIANTVLKLSFWKFWQVCIFSLLCAVFILFTCQYSIVQSKTQLSDLLQNRIVMQDMAVVITLESVIFFAFCISALRNLYSKRKKKRARIFYWYPGLLIFLVLFYIQTELIFSLPRTDFYTISTIFALAVFILLPALSFFIRYVCPEKELRLEIQFLVSLFVALIGLIATVNGNITYSAVEQSINILDVVQVLLLFAICFAIGLFATKLKWHYRKKQNKNNNHINLS